MGILESGCVQIEAKERETKGVGCLGAVAGVEGRAHANFGENSLSE